MFEVTRRLAPRAEFAGGDVRLDMSMHAGIPVIARQQFNGFGSAVMACE